MGNGGSCGGLRPLAVCAGRLRPGLCPERRPPAQGGGVSLLADTAAVDFELQSAASQLLQAKVLIGTYDQAALPAFHDLAIVGADGESYCLQVGYGTQARYLASPGGLPAPGPC